MPYLVVAYPELSPSDFEQLQDHRKTHDALFNIIEPHFTLVFAVTDIARDEFIKEIKTRQKVLENSIL